MASLIKGYEYDIFISYRQKDNKGDRWVSAFVEALETELESTFKEDISVYFDINPHDGILETHDVDASLKEKLKCLVFIPIISRTYCDPKSFAWEHELKAFVEQARQDHFGLKVKLPNGNVASRVLPVRIYDLDRPDIKLCEAVMGGALRGIDFIYTETGVNRPLKPDDDEKINLNRTKYRNQINKAGNAIKEIVTAITKHDQQGEEIIQKSITEKPAQPKGRMVKTISISFIAILLIVAGFLIIPKLFKTNEQLEKSIAVLPFANLSNDPEQEYFSDGMVDAILDNLFKVGDLIVISRTSSMRYKNTELTLKEIARELKVTHILEGSVQKIGERVRITTQLIDAETDRHLWSDTFDGELTDVFAFQSNVAKTVASKLKIALTVEEADHLKGSTPSSSPFAYDFYLRGNDYWSRYEAAMALDMYSKAIEEDTLFAMAYAKRALMHFYLFWNRKAGWPEHRLEGLEDMGKAVDINSDLTEIKFAQAVKTYWIDRDYNKSLRMLDEIKKATPNMAELYAWSAYNMRRQGLLYESVIELEKGIELDPFNANYIDNLGQSYELIHQYDKMIEWSEKGLSRIPDREDFKSALLQAFLHKTGDFNLALDKSGLKEDNVRYYIHYYTRQYDGLIEIINKESEYVGDQIEYDPPVYRLALTYFLAGNISHAKAYADSSVAFMNEKIKEIADEDRYYATLGKSYALAGNEEEAIACGIRAISLKPVSLDAFQGPAREEELMKIYILTGNFDLALDKIEYLLSIPSWLSKGLLIADPIYDGLRDLTRFQKIIESVNPE